MVRSLSTASVVAVLLCAGGMARADASDAVAAEALFAEGRRLMAAGKLDEACPKLAESQRLDPAPGTLLNLGACYERAGKTASAWYAYTETETAAARAGQKDRAVFAKKQARLLEGKLSRITIAVAADASADALEIRRGGSLVGQGSLGTPLPVDPGSYLIEATAPGRRKWSTRVQVDPGPSTVSVTIPKLEAEVVAPAPAAAVERSGTGLSAVAEPRPSDADRSRGQGQRMAGLTVGAVGLAAIGVGAYFGLKAGATYDEAKSACGGTTVCADGRGLALRDDAGQQAMVSTVAFVGGAALAAGGALLFLTAPKRARPNEVGIAVSPHGSGAIFSMRGAW